MKRDVSRFKQEQLKLAKKVVVKDDFDEIKLVGGVDQSFKDNKIISAVVVCDAKTGKIVERKYASVDAKMPYIPGFLSYRESPAAVEAIISLENKPDILLVDGHGVLHPRGLGIASHIGLLMDVPTIGVANNLLVGESKGCKVYVDDKLKGKKLVTREHARPIYISAGHRVSLKTAIAIVENNIHEPHKLPEPLHLAHKFSRKLAKDGLDEDIDEKNKE